MVCKKCSAELPENAIFCLHCGTRVDGNKLCKNCEKLIPEAAVFCLYCGAKQDAVVAPVAPVAPVVPVAAVTPVASVVPDKQTTEDESELVKGIICPQCGSVEIELISTELGKCRSCGTQVVINTPKQESVITNNVNINMSPVAGEPIIEYYELVQNMSEQEFLVNALTLIAIEKETPDDIFEKGKLKPVKKEYGEYLFAKGVVDMTYSATIGYDRQEKYYVKEKRYRNGVEYYEDVEKTRTVTDWHPYSGTYKGENYGKAINDGMATDEDLLDYYVTCLKNAVKYDASKSKSPAPKAPTPSGLSEVKSSVKNSAENTCKNSLPGDRNKDFRSSGTVELVAIDSHIAPQYKLEYEYGGKQYTSKAHAVKESYINGAMPSAKKETQNEIEHNKSVKGINLITLIALILSIAVSVLLPTVFKIIFLALAVAFFIIYYIVRAKVSKAIYKEKAKKKKRTLMELLSRKGIKASNELKEDL